MTYLLPSLMLLALVVGIFSGYPVAFLLAGLSVLFMLLGDIPLASFSLITSRVFGAVLENWILAAIPLFIFMGIMLDKSKVANKLLNELEALFGGKPGGLGLAVVIIGIIMAASTGIIGASVVLMGTMALPLMLRQGYDKTVAIGTVLGSGTLGILIPPSIMLVVFGDVMQIPIGDLFAGALIPGLMLGGFYALYIIYVALTNPRKVPPGPAPPAGSRAKLILRLMSNLVVPGLLISSVLVSIVVGFATPTEGAAIGAFGAMVLALFSGQLSWSVLKSSLKETCLTTGMILILAIGATAFSLVFKRVGGQSMIEDAAGMLGASPYMVILAIMVLIFVLGFFLEWIEISFLVLPLFAPIVAGLDFGDAFANQGEVMIWFALLVAINLQTSFLTPPFGYALFYLKGIAIPGVTTADIYRGVVPIVLMQLLGVLLVALFPIIALWLPGKV
ncbi:C4-dicarboxylate ABC transporter [Pollutimonas nitritireducens]|uniref:TRAP transporter large permease protein n=1 Tax=Pollutimonas nitritireducens TaxID=2045209 RepID=A0A2N4UE87_9BURK|nr:TRAP transporter large permease subunit [Pollutimonas nitritireducens]PLC53317.1 C4-dicarboxylate ABC transporter [Pollutimonas nitritireducens]